jgi:hypothetical protein
MAGTIDDRRTAANITSSLSSYLITAALGVIAAQTVIVTFILDKREHLLWFYVISVMALVAAIESIYFGGKGIWQLTRRGYEGDWIIRPSGARFNTQAALVLASAFFVFLSVFCGSPKPEKPSVPPELAVQANQLRELQKNIGELETKVKTISTQLDTLKARGPQKTTSSRKKR